MSMNQYRMKRARARIMRRVYLHYTFGLLAHRTFLSGFSMFVILLLLTHFVSLKHVIANMLATKLGDLHLFIAASVLETEVWTLVLGGALIMAALSFRISLRPRRLLTPALS